MIDVINLKNFLLFKNTIINIEDSLNLFIGESSSGKSLILKSIYELLGESHIKEDFSISIQINNDIIKKQRLKNKISYFVNDELSSLKMIKEKLVNLVIISQNNKNQLNNLYFKRIISSGYKNIDILNEYYLKIKKIKRDLKDLNKNDLEYEKKRLESIIEDFNEVSHIDFDNEFSFQSLEKDLSEISNLLEKNSFIEQSLNESKWSFNKYNISIQESIDSISEINQILVEKKENIENQINNQEEFILNQKILERFQKKYNIYDDNQFKISLEKNKSDLKKVEDYLEETLIKEDQLNLFLKKYNEENKILLNFVIEEKENIKKSIEHNLKSLMMENSQIFFNITETDNILENGSFNVETLFSPNKGFKAESLSKIASGGELSRLLISINLIDKNNKVFILDEIDTGLGGDTANLLAKKVKDLGKKNQVIYITHLPQMAKISENIFKITKNNSKNKSFSEIKKLNNHEMIEEVARLMGESSNEEIKKLIRSKS